MVDSRGVSGFGLHAASKLAVAAPLRRLLEVASKEVESEREGVERIGAGVGCGVAGDDVDDALGPLDSKWFRILRVWPAHVMPP